MRLNLGCGTNAVDGWRNIDRSPGVLLSRLPVAIRSRIRRFIPRQQADVEWPPNVVRLDVTKGLPFDDGSVEAIYSSHMLEHLPRDDAEGVLLECRRVLAPGGVLRLVLPDLRQIAERYLASREADAAEAFIESSMLGQRSRPAGRAALVAKLSGAAHRWMYDAASIRHLCLRCGFSATEEWTFGNGECPDLGLVDVESRRDGSFYVEAYP